MTSKKLLPLVVGAVILIIGLSVFFINEKNKKHYDKLIVSYKAQNTEFTKLNVNTSFVIGNVTFWVTGVSPNKIYLMASENIEDTNEIDIKLNDTKSLCFASNDCIYFSLN